MDSVSQISLKFQGGLVKTSIKNPPLPGDEMRSQSRVLAGSVRGSVTEFSRKSRKRLLDKLMSLDRKQVQMKPPVFITLTYGQSWPDTPTAKRHLKNFLECFRRSNPQMGAIWRIEYQKRGAPHFHLIAFNLPYFGKVALAMIWLAVIGDEYADHSSDEVRAPFTRIEMIKGWRQLVGYLSKYVAKFEDAASSASLSEAASDASEASSGFNYVPYSHAGRWWGVHNRQMLPWAQVVELMAEGIGRAYLDMRRAAGRKYTRLRLSGMVTGFTLYVRDAYQWSRLWDYLGRMEAAIAAP